MSELHPATLLYKKDLYPPMLTTVGFLNNVSRYVAQVVYITTLLTALHDGTRYSAQNSKIIVSIFSSNEML